MNSSLEPLCSQEDLKKFHEGKHYEIFRFMGAHRICHQNQEGIRFLVWAPHAKSVSVIGDFNQWNPDISRMQKLSKEGVFGIFIPDLTDGQKYQYAIYGENGVLYKKSDPYGFYFGKRPGRVSVVYDPAHFVWEDDPWFEKNNNSKARPLNIYEVHLGSWEKKKDGFYNYRELAEKLAKYCKKMNYTHVELLPIMEHPLDESWGYEVTGYYAPTSRYGSPDDFRYFVNYLHQQGIGVIIDWVPGHFPADEFSLVKFDGEDLYEYPDPKKGFHPQWNTLVFNYEKKEVTNFLIGSALFWLEEMHVDGLRVDAVASLIYLDYERKQGEWEPNQYGTNHNLEAIEFLKHLNEIVQKKFQSRLMIAEESTAFKGVTHGVKKKGLGFAMKWNMGWMHDTLHYFSKDPYSRKYYHKDLIFSFHYAFFENFLLPLSHDEVVHEKKSLIEKMPGKQEEQFKQLRLLYSYMMCHPGKKLLFMGGELGQIREWNCKDQIDWHLLQEHQHRHLQDFVRRLNAFYLHNPALWEYDFDEKGLQTVGVDDHESGVVSFLRKGEKQTLLCIHHFTPVLRKSYHIPLKTIKDGKEVFCSEAPSQKNFSYLPIIEKKQGVTITLLPLSTLILEVKLEKKND